MSDLTRFYDKSICFYGAALGKNKMKSHLAGTAVTLLGDGSYSFVTSQRVACPELPQTCPLTEAKDKVFPFVGRCILVESSGETRRDLSGGS